MSSLLFLHKHKYFTGVGLGVHCFSESQLRRPSLSDHGSRYVSLEFLLCMLGNDLCDTMYIHILSTEFTAWHKLST